MTEHQQAGMITALEVQKHNTERVNVYLDGEFAFGLAMIEAAKLYKGQQLSAAEIAALQAQDTVHQLLDQAVRFLSYRPRSIHEVRQNLAKKKADPAAVDEVIAQLERLGYVDDLAFARFWVQNRDEFRPKGPRALTYELRKKGITNSMIEQVLAEVDFAGAAYRAAERQARRLSSTDRRTFRQKLYEYLARRGFLPETIRDTIDALLEQYQEHLAGQEGDDSDYNDFGPDSDREFEE